jgi:hypothetical protein
MTKKFRVHKTRDVSTVRKQTNKWLNEVVPKSYLYEEVWLFYRGKELEDDEESLKDCEIESDSKIHVMLVTTT